MTDARPLKAGDHGPYGQLSGRPLPADLGVLFTPSLAALLDEAERLAGRPLVDAEVVHIRDAAVAVVVPADVARAVAAERGYPEVDPADPWPSWQTIR